MKISVNTLRKIIREEVSKEMQRNDPFSHFKPMSEEDLWGDEGDVQYDQICQLLGKSSVNELMTFNPEAEEADEAGLAAFDAAVAAFQPAGKNVRGPNCTLVPGALMGRKCVHLQDDMGISVLFC